MSRATASTSSWSSSGKANRWVKSGFRGGELFKYLHETKRFSEERARFYGAQIAIALGHLHKSRIIYRDLKPENILVGDDGYIMLADFGLAKIRNTSDAEDPNSFCGTPEYLGKTLFGLIKFSP